MILTTYSEKQLNYARHTNVFEYMLARGEAFESVGRHWRHTEHDSLTVSKKTNIATWRSRSNCHSYKNAIAFISEFYEEPYEQVVMSLLDFRSGKNMTKETTQMIEQHRQTIAKEVTFSLENLNQQGNYDTNYLSERGRNYLRSRFLSEDTITIFERKRMISSDNRNNVLFKIGDLTTNEPFRIVGAAVQGTTPKKLTDRIHERKDGSLKLERKYFKGLALNSHPERGFLFGAVSDDSARPTLYVTEAPLESISLYELSKENLPKNVWFLSTEGLKDQILWATVNKLQELFPNSDGIDIVLAYNNDEKGREAIKRLHSAFQNDRNYHQNHALKLLLPDLENGDWNEILELAKTGKITSRIEKQAERAAAQKIFETRQEHKTKGMEMEGSY